MITLVETTDADFKWMLGGDSSRDGLRLPPGGVDTPGMLNVIRWMRRRLRAQHDRGAWMMVCAGEVVGLCSYKGAPTADGEVEIGFGVAGSRRNQGYASSAVAAALAEAVADPAVKVVTASTSTTNSHSQRVLQRNGFVQAGTGHDPDEGEMILWRRELA